MFGWSRKRGSPCGRCPVRIGGTAPVVHSCTVVAFRNQVASSANRAKFGYRTASSSPSARSRETVGSSSKTTMTTGAPDGVLATWSSGGLSRRRDTGEKPRKRTRTRSGARPDNRQQHPGWARACVHKRGDASDRRDDCDRADAEPAEAGRARSATSTARKARWSTVAALRLARPASASRPSRRRGGRTTMPTAKRTTSQRVEPRTAKNSTFRERRSKSGCATASADSPAR